MKQQKYSGVYKSKSTGKQTRVVYLPKENKATSKWGWTVLGKTKRWFSKKTDAIKYAKK